MKNSHILILLILILFQIFCSSGLSPEEYLSYYEKNKHKYTETIERNSVKAVICYQPNEFFIARELASNTSDNNEIINNKYNKSLFFTLSLSSDKKQRGSFLLEREGVQGFSKNVFKNTFNRGNNFFLSIQTDTVKIADYHYERNWGIGNEDIFLLTFNRNQLNRKITDYHLIIRDITPEIGTIDIPLKNLVKNTKMLKGY